MWKGPAGVGRGCDLIYWTRPVALATPLATLFCKIYDLSIKVLHQSLVKIRCHKSKRQKKKYMGERGVILNATHAYPHPSSRCGCCVQRVTLLLLHLLLVTLRLWLPPLLFLALPTILRFLLFMFHSIMLHALVVTTATHPFSPVHCAWASGQVGRAKIWLT